MLSTSNGARGFFVNWLTGDEWTVADGGTQGSLFEALCTTENPQMICELMVMNVMMPAATALAHRRRHNDAMADVSIRTSKRATRLIRAIMPERQPALIPRVDGALAAVSAGIAAAESGMPAPYRTISGDGGVESEWDVFVGYHGYDNEQLRAVRCALLNCCP